MFSLPWLWTMLCTIYELLMTILETIQICMMLHFDAHTDKSNF